MSANILSKTLIELEAAHGVPAISRGLILLAAKYAFWKQNHRTRAHLSRLSDHGLEDIGLTREQAHNEARKMFYKP